MYGRLLSIGMTQFYVSGTSFKSFINDKTYNHIYTIQISSLFNRFSDLPGHFDTERTSVSCQQEEWTSGEHSENLCSGVLPITTKSSDCNYICSTLIKMELHN